MKTVPEGITEAPMNRATVRDLAGALALAALFALASPGVQVARAESPRSPTFAGTGDAAMCRVDDPAPLRSSAAAYAAQRLREAMLAGGEDEVRVLNGRGHNYRRDRDPMAELALLEAEARRQQLEAEGR